MMFQANLPARSSRAWAALRLEHNLMWPLGFLLVLALTTALAHSLVDELEVQQGAVMHSAQVGHELQTVLQMTVDIESGTRGVALTRDRNFLVTAVTAAPELQAGLARLRELTRHEPLLAASVAELARVVDLRVARAHALEQQAVSGQPIMKADLAEGQRLQDRIRIIFGAIAAHERAKREQSVRNAARVRIELKFGLILSMLVLGGFGWMWFRARQRLRRTQENYRHMFDSAANGMALIGPDGCIVEVNHSYAAMLGYTPPELVGRDYCTLGVGEDQPQARAALLALLGGSAEVRRDELRYERADGAVVWVRSALSRARDTGSGKAQVLMVSENVTERRRSDELLRRSAVLLRNAGRMAAIDGWYLGLPAGPLQLGANLCQWLDLDGDDAAGMLAKLDAGNRRRLLAALAACRRQGAAFDIELEIAFGTATLTLRVMGQGVSAQNGILGIDGAVQDISLQKRVQRNLQKSEGRFRAVAQVTNDGIWDWDIASGVIWRSPGTALLLGMQPGELDSADDAWLQRIHPDDRTDVAAAFARARQAGVEEFAVEYRVRRADASYAFVHDKGRLLRDEQGAVVRVVGGIRDLTERKRSQQALMGMAASVPNGDSDAFFVALLRHLIEALGADAGAIARPLDDDPARMRAVAAIVDGGAVLEAMEYPIAGSPCALLENGGETIIPDQLAQCCPHAPGMPGVEARAYAGHRLCAADGTILGVIFVLFRKPVTELDMIGAILRVFAARASAEMERLDGASRMREQAALLDQAREAIVVLALNLSVRFWNRGASLMIGRAAHDMLGGSVLACYAEPQAARDALAAVLEQGEWVGETVQIRADGALVTVNESWTLVRDRQGKPHSILKVGTDVTEKRAAQEQIRRLAYYDTLTGLPNRRLLMDRIGQLQLRMARHGRCGALLFIDMDNFKSLNDHHGHAAGDEFLRQSAQRLGACVRADDTVARLGGDEFVILLDNLDPDPDLALQQAHAIGVAVVNAFRAPVEIGAIMHRSTASVGIVLVSDQDDADAGALLRQADQAMYQAKNGGRNGVVMASGQREPVLVADDLLEALERGEIGLWLQPQCATHGAAAGALAALRWRRPDGAWLEADEFLPFAERCGAMQALEAFMLERCAAILARWQAPAWQGHGLSIAASAQQLRDPQFAQRVLAALAAAGADAAGLTVEMSEAAIDTQVTLETIAALRAGGVRVAAHHFSLGAASLARLRSGALDAIVLDQEMTRRCASTPVDAQAVRAIAGMAHALGLRVVADGVADPAQRAFLREVGCDLLRGPLAGAPHEESVRAQERPAPAAGAGHEDDQDDEVVV